ncbi:S-layer homology domain-containing protein [Aeromicrobium piscarium]|uniref:Fibronectin type-III domain-containing protein n=1 Tax=Aeromicrobium piscarium TaxID=2590901 RepID=A0A554S7M9_9ACTN|nr:S-layer homology domain-containing protein [Aeromicrobium piscarium]TSD62352.1 hypothetical protein FNM00_12005 [Aeromicrobium piscarium]
MSSSTRLLALVAGAPLIIGLLASPSGAAEDPAPPPTFTDVPADHQFATEISWLAQTGVATGYADGTFRPDGAVERQAMAAFLHRFDSGVDLPVPAYTPFGDVPTSHQFYEDIAWLRDSAVTSGYSDGTFRPRGSVERQAMAAFLYRAAGSPQFDAPARPTFRDVSRSHQFYREIEWLNSTGITTGFHDGTFRARASVERKAMAAFLMRYDRSFHRGSAVDSAASTTNRIEISALSTEGFDVAWAPYEGAAAYRFSWGRTADGGGAESVSLTASTTARHLRQLRPGTTYYVTVEALDTDGAVLATMPAKVVTRPLQPVSVATYNVAAADYAVRAWASRRSALWAAVNSRHPDVIALQEASQNPYGASEPHPTTPDRYYDDVVRGMTDGDHRYRLVNRVPWNCRNPDTPGHQGWNGESWTRCHGAQIVDQGASRDLRIAYNPGTMEVVRSGSHLLTGPETITGQRSDDRYMAWAEFRQIATGKRFLFATAHLSPAQLPRRVEHATKTRDEIERLNVERLPVVIAGDMNTARWDADDAYAKVIAPFGAKGYTELQGSRPASWERLDTGLRTRYVGRVNCNSFNGFSNYVLSSASGSSPKCAHNAFTETYRNGNNIDYIFTKGIAHAPVFENVADIDNTGRWRSTIPSDHNMIRAEILLP